MIDRDVVDYGLVINITYVGNVYVIDGAIVVKVAALPIASF